MIEPEHPWPQPRDAVQPRFGDLALCHTDTTGQKKFSNPIAYLEQKIGKSYWNHVAIVGPRRTDFEPRHHVWCGCYRGVASSSVHRGCIPDRLVIEATLAGVTQCFFSELQRHYDEVLLVKPPYPDSVLDPVFTWIWAASQKGKRYSVLDLFQIVLWELTGMYRPWKTPAFICSELACLGLARGNVFLIPANGTVWTLRDITDGLDVSPR